MYVCIYCTVFPFFVHFLVEYNFQWKSSIFIYVFKYYTKLTKAHLRLPLFHPQQKPKKKTLIPLHQNGEPASKCCAVGSFRAFTLHLMAEVRTDALILKPLECCILPLCMHSKTIIFLLEQSKKISKKAYLLPSNAHLYKVYTIYYIQFFQNYVCFSYINLGTLIWQFGFFNFANKQKHGNTKQPFSELHFYFVFCSKCSLSNSM